MARAGQQVPPHVGIGPVTLRDNTKPLQVDVGRHLAIEARARPLGRARVDFVLSPANGGTKVTIAETLVPPLVVKALNPLLAPVIRRRNVQALGRLANLVRTAATT